MIVMNTIQVYVSLITLVINIVPFIGTQLMSVMGSKFSQMQIASCVSSYDTSSKAGGVRDHCQMISCN